MEINHKLQQDFDLLNFHLNNSPLAFIRWDEHFRITTWSAKAQQLFGYTQEDVEGLNPLALDFLDADTRKQIRQKMDELISGELSSNKMQLYIKTKTGRLSLIELYNSALLDEAGNLISAVSFAHDITRRKNAEERILREKALLSQLFENSPIGIARLDKEDRVVDINKSFERLFGYRLAEIKGESIDNLIVPGGSQEASEAISHKTHAGESTQMEAVRTRKDGSEIPVLVGGVPVNVQDNIIAVYAMYVDLTERKKAEQEIKKTLKEKETLLAEIHHRVKNNLAVISGLLELQVFNSESMEVKNALRYSQSRIMSIAVIHERLYQSDTLSGLNCREFVNKLVKSVSNTHHNKNKTIALEQSVDSFTLSITQAIPLALILNELLVNAFEHAFQHISEGRIHVGLAKTGNLINLRVSDNGQGFPDNLDSEIPKSLGMTLIHTLVKQLKGDFDMNNTNGSSFEIKFKME